MALDRVIRSLSRVFVGLALAWLLVGCEIALFDVEQTVTFTGDETWKADVSIVIPAEVVNAPGSPADLRAEIERQLVGEQIPELEAAGVKIDWGVRTTEVGDTEYALHLEGDQFATLERAVFDESTDIQQTVVEGRREIEFSQFSAATPMGIGVRDYTLILIGGEIISGNGVRIDAGTMRWVNPDGVIEARLTPKTRFSLIGIVLPVACGLGFVALAAGAVIAGLAYARRQDRAI